jgi:hypothetical protein
VQLIRFVEVAISSADEVTDFLVKPPYREPKYIAEYNA